MDQVKYPRAAQARASHRPTTLATAWQGRAPRRPEKLGPAPTMNEFKQVVRKRPPIQQPTPIAQRIVAPIPPIQVPETIQQIQPSRLAPVETVAAAHEHKPKPQAVAVQDSPTVSIRITIPDSQSLTNLLAWRPSAKQLIFAFVAFCIFTIGYQAGRHTAAPTLKAASIGVTGKNA
jgi:hypothetical protein